MELANSRIALETSKRELEGARFVLASIWGSTSPVFEKVEGQFEMAKPIPTVEQLANRISPKSKHRTLDGRDSPSSCSNSVGEIEARPWLVDWRWDEAPQRE